MWQCNWLEIGNETDCLISLSKQNKWTRKSMCLKCSWSYLWHREGNGEKRAFSSQVIQWGCIQNSVWRLNFHRQVILCPFTPANTIDDDHWHLIDVSSNTNRSLSIGNLLHYNSAVYRLRCSVIFVAESPIVWLPWQREFWLWAEQEHHAGIFLALTLKKANGRGMAPRVALSRGVRTVLLVQKSG